MKGNDQYPEVTIYVNERKWSISGTM